MNNDLKKHIHHLINISGNMPLDQFLFIVTQFYYANSKSLGADGDFITAPEISQMFGEIIGIWCSNQWLNNNRPKLALIELGPGNGYLMQDLLRSTKNIPEFHNSIQSIILIETSKKLELAQKNALLHYSKEIDIYWLDSIKQIADHINNTYTIIIANEFFDALPIKQFIRSKRGFHEVAIRLDKDNLVLHSLPFEVTLKTNFDYKHGEIAEISPLANSSAFEIAQLIKKNKGAAIIIDYGYLIPPLTSTLQAIRNHKKYSNIFSSIGQSDITSLVDFQNLINIFTEQSLQYVFNTQAEFLLSYGIKQRAEALVKYGADITNIDRQLDILLNANKMGSLFKVLQIYS